MNYLLLIGLLLIIGFIAGWILDKIGLPKIIGYIFVGIIFSPNNNDIIDNQIIQSTNALMEICLAFIAFEVGGTLKWSRIKKNKKAIISITLFASFLPFILITAGVFSIGILFPSIISLDIKNLTLLSLVLGALASPTAPAATFAVMRQYKAKGKVTDTILGVVALDDVMGILLFSLTIAIVFMFTAGDPGLFTNPIFNSFYELFTAIFIGLVLGIIINPISKIFKISGEGQWVVILFSFLIFIVGISKVLHIDILLPCMTMGMVVANKSKQQKVIFKIIERYTEDLILLFFFMLSGFHLAVASLPQAGTLIFLFFILRTIGKFSGAYIGARFVKADKSIQKYTAGGLLPQAGIVIGLVFSIYQEEQFNGISEILLTTVIGATIIHEIIGPIITKYTLKKAGELKNI